MAKRLIGAALILLFFSPLIGGQDTGEEYLKPSKNLIVEGVPPIPKSYAKLYYEYYRYAYVKLKGWDPVKRELWVQGGTQLVYSMPAPGVNGKIVAPIKFPRIGNYEYYFDRQGKNVIYSLDIDGKELPQLYYWDADTQKSTKLTEDGSRNVEPVWSRSGEWVVWGSTPPGGDGQDLYIMNPRKPESKRILIPSNSHPIKAFDWSPDDKFIVYIEYISLENESYIWIIEANTPAHLKTNLSRKFGKAYFDSPVFDKSGTGIYTLSNVRSEYTQLCLINIKSLKLTSLTNNFNWDVEEFAVSPDSNQVALVINEDGISNLYIFNLRANTIKEIPDVSKGIISSLSWHFNSTDLAFNIESPNSPGDIYVTNLTSGETVCWAKANIWSGKSKQLIKPEIIKPEIIKWKSFDGKMISGIIYRPLKSESSPPPVVIEIHGGPEDQARPGFNIDDYIFVKELGIVKINPNIRGSTGYGKTFSSLDNGIKRVNALKDIGALLKAIRADNSLDSSRVIVTGASYGGYMALLTAVQYNDYIRGSICDSGPSNLSSFLETTNGWRRNLRRAEYGNEKDILTRQSLEKMAPRNNVSKINKPILIIQGANDPRTNLSESVQMLAALRKRRIETWSLIATDEGHTFSKANNRAFQFATTMVFLQRLLSE